MILRLTPAPLINDTFAPFGDVIESDGADHFSINRGFTERHNDLASVDVHIEDVSANISLLIKTQRPAPIAIRMMERHPLGSQIFFPLQDHPWLVVVCTDPKIASSYRVFCADGRQGINYALNVRHHPLLVLENESRFIFGERKGPGTNLEESWLPEDSIFFIETFAWEFVLRVCPL